MTTETTMPPERVDEAKSGAAVHSSVLLGELELHNADCMAIMSKHADKYFDIAIVDPPYGIGWTDSINYSESQKAHQVKCGYKLHTPKKWDSEKPTAEYFAELRRVSKNQIIWGGNYFTDCLPPARGWVVWNKMCETFTAINNELAWSSYEKKIPIFSRPHGMDKGFLDKDGGHIHPTQKPVALYSWLLERYAEKGQRILDTHMGSGSLAIACHRAGYPLVACEIDTEYYEKAIERIKRDQRQTRLFT